MAGLLIVNPRSRSRKKASPKKRARRVRRATSVTVRSNPVRARRRKSAIRSNPVPGFKRARRAKSHRRIRRNPIGHSAGGFLKPLMHAVPGAVGAVAVNLVLSKLPLPAMLTTGVVKHVARVGVILGLGMLANKVSRSPMIGQAIQGALTVSVYESIKELAAGAGMNLGDDMGMGDTTEELGFYSPATTIDGYIDSPAMGEYVSGYDPTDDGIGEYVSADEYSDGY